ncbi:transcription factor bHLH94-like [Canna indica]|uniref:Transcription factor bHLH94-like n=1 Tax=Canna indica TaxID=4628 RepID=A0AAQ3JUC4_9LILI|nr:transcription factor bHLH94-like [Canna indica]
MALEAVVFPQDLLGCTAMMELYSMGGGAAWSYTFGAGGGAESELSGDDGKKSKVAVGDGMHGSGNLDASCASIMPAKEEGGSGEVAATAGRRKRRRTKILKNQEEVENQRMTHIAVERNRRKQMNEYLAVLRSLMPASYVQRGDQASIIGGAINFVKELEQLVQSLEARKRIEQRMEAAPFADFFTFPQYSTSSSHSALNNNAAAAGDAAEGGGGGGGGEKVLLQESQQAPALADIEVTMVESHANLKVLARRQPKQLLNMVLGLQNLRLTILHLNVTTIADMAFCSFSLKVEDDCQLTSVDDIATAVHQLVGIIQEKADCDTTI